MQVLVEVVVGMARRLLESVAGLNRESETQTMSHGQESAEAVNIFGSN